MTTTRYPMRISARLPHLAGLLAMVAMLLTTQSKCCQAEWGLFRAKQHHATQGRGLQSHTTACPECGHICKFKAEMVDEQHHRFDVETKVICIPRVVFPWQMQNGKPCTTNGARMRIVHEMTKEDYSCPECSYTWEAIKLNPDGTQAAEVSGAKARPSTAPTSPKRKLQPQPQPQPQTQAAAHFDE